MFKEGMLVRLKLKDNNRPGLSHSAALLKENGTYVSVYAHSHIDNKFIIVETTANAVQGTVCLLSFSTPKSKRSAKRLNTSWVEAYNLQPIVILKKHNV